jgi:hypothetical protein
MSVSVCGGVSCRILNMSRLVSSHDLEASDAILEDKLRPYYANRVAM